MIISDVYSFLFLANCNHAFCLSCIRQWRGTSDSSANKIVRYDPKINDQTRTTQSRYIVARASSYKKGAVGRLVCAHLMFLVEVAKMKRLNGTWEFFTFRHVQSVRRLFTFYMHVLRYLNK